MIKCQGEDCKAGDWTIKQGLPATMETLRISIDHESKSDQGQLKLGMGCLRAFIPNGSKGWDDRSTGET